MPDTGGAPRHRQFGDFALQAKLGGGGQGEVWRAQRPDGTLVALKLIPLSLDAEHASHLRRRVALEITALQSVSHPTVVRALETGVRYERLYIAFELIDGQNAYEALHAPMPPTIDDCSAFLRSVAPGVDAVHRVGLVHRDIKPSNIVLRRSDWASPILVDFGYVRVEGASSLTDTGVIVGTTSYIAPEVLRSPDNASPLSDQWSLGRVVLETLAVALGHDLDTFSGNGDMLGTCHHDSPAACGVLTRVLSSDPGQRYGSVGAMADAFHEALIADGLIEPPVVAQASALVPVADESLRDYLLRLGCTMAVDLRPGGCLWFFGDHETLSAAQAALAARGISIAFARNGGRQTDRKPAWWTKHLG